MRGAGFACSISYIYNKEGLNDSSCFLVLFAIVFGDLFAGFSVASFSLLEAFDGFHQVFFVEVRPEGVAEVEFGVGTLPEEVVAQSDFSSGSDEQVGVRHEGGEEVLGDGFFRDVLRFDFSVCHFLCDSLHGVREFHP